jgi:hypothetical protein
MVLVALTASPGVHDVPDQDREQEDGDESTDERPEHRPNDTSGVQCDLLVGRRERVGDLETPLLAEHESQLAGWPEPVRMSGSEGGTGPAARDRAEHPLAEKAVVATRLRCARAPTRHALSSTFCSLKTALPTVHIKADSSPPRQPRFPENATTSQHLDFPGNCGHSVLPDRIRPHFP